MTDKLLTYSGPRALLERAASSVSGIRIWFATRAEAVACQNRMSTVKTNLRKRAPEDPQLTAFDSMILRITPADFRDVWNQAKAQRYFNEALDPTTPAWSDIPLEDPLPGGWWLYITPYDGGAQGYLIQDLADLEQGPAESGGSDTAV